MEFDLSKIDWAAIAAIISFIMVVVTSVALILNNQQLKELKRQWEEQNRPYISMEIFQKKYREYHLSITNIGNSAVVNARINIDEDYLQSLYECFDNPKDPDDFIFNSYKRDCIERFKTINNTVVSLPRFQRIDFYFVSFISCDIVPVHLSISGHKASSNLSNILWNKPIPIKVTYNGYTQCEDVVFKVESSNTIGVLNTISNNLEKIGLIYEADVREKYETK